MKLRTAFIETKKQSDPSFIIVVLYVFACFGQALKDGADINRQINNKYTDPMLGIILWAVIIFIIVCYTCPGFITALIVISTSVFTAYGLILWVAEKIRKR